MDLIRALEERPHAFGFFQAVRILTLVSRRMEGRLPADLRFRSTPSLAFPSSEITRLGSAEGPDRSGLELETGLLGLIGPDGILPLTYTETILERRFLQREDTLHAFLDIFHHRACALYFMAWRKVRFHFALEPIPAGGGREQGFGDAVQRLLPVRMPESPGSAFLQEALASFAGALARKPLPATSLEAFLRSCFRVRARLESFVGVRITVPPRERARLGSADFSLGSGALLGERLLDHQNKVRLVLDALGPGTFQAFLPGGPSFNLLAGFMKACLGPLLACDLRLVPRGEAIPDLRLGSREPSPPRLGMDSWLATRPLPPNPPDALFPLLA